MQLITTRIPEVYVEKLNQLVERNLYNCRSEAIRIAVRDFIILEFDRIREEGLNNPKNKSYFVKTIGNANENVSRSYFRDQLTKFEKKEDRLRQLGLL